MLRFETAIAVMVNHDGEPYAFKLADTQYLVCSKPVRWYSRKTWWKEAKAAPKGIGPSLIEVEMWRLWASCDSGQALFELRHEVHANNWQLVQLDEK
ncbi:MAG: hypothetical protein RLZZ122_1123 [Actinomycetota bacterium]